MSFTGAPEEKLEYDSHIEEADEKWLISYSDMMTLLFGLFVMLYAMSSHLDQVKKAAAKQFLTDTAPPAPAAVVGPAVDPILDKTKADLAAALNSLEGVKSELAEAQEQSKEKEAGIEAAHQEISKLKTDLSLARTRAATAAKPKAHKADPSAALAKQVQLLESEKDQSDEQVQHLSLENKNLHAQLAKLGMDQKQSAANASQLSVLKRKLAAQEQAGSAAREKEEQMREAEAALRDEQSQLQSKLAAQVQAGSAAKEQQMQLQRKLASQLAAQEQASTAAKEQQVALNDKVKSLEGTIDQLRKTQTDNERKIAEQNAAIAKYEEKKAHSSGPFAAIVMTWSTQNHDIDLIVTDPEGKAFDFKRRSYPQHPGRFVLDTRRGPGAEMWESNKLVPGVYKINYVFYNTYGNQEPVVVSGSIYSAAGIFELPKVQLDFATKREQVFKVRISESGEAKILP